MSISSITLQSRRPGPLRRSGFTITELLVVLLVAAVMLAALIPAVHRLRGEGGQGISAANLQTLGAAHAAYAADWNDRQVSWIADDFAFTGGAVGAYSSQIGCQSPLLLGFNLAGGLWGYFLPCHQSGGNQGNIAVYKAIEFATGGATGAHRLANARPFRPYVSETFYDPRFYAPNDTITYQIASAAFDHPGEFVFSTNGGPTHPQTGAPVLVFSSYALSPAAMVGRDVLARNEATGLWFTDPNSLSRGYRTPSVSTCAHPELKTRMIEHNWNFGQPGPVNPAFAGGITPYYFSHGIDAAPLTLFFDGRVAELPNAQVAADDAAVLAGTNGEVGLWTRDTPLGAHGYYGDQSWDGFVTGHHVLTADGIRGRDILTSKPSGVGGAGLPRSTRRTEPAPIVTQPELMPQQRSKR